MSILDIPAALSVTWGIPLGVAGFICFIILTGFVVFPAAILLRGRGGLQVELLLGFSVLVLSVLLGWVDVWVLVFIGALIALGFANKMRDTVGA